MQLLEVIGLTKGVVGELPVQVFLNDGFTHIDQLFEVPVLEFRGQITQQSIHINGAIRLWVHKQQAIFFLRRQFHKPVA